MEVCVPGYGTGSTAPLIGLNGVGEYYCIDTILKAHATAFHSYKNKYYAKFRGKIGITLNSRFFFSMVNDTDLVDYAMQFWVNNYKKIIKKFLYLIHFVYLYSSGGLHIRYTAKPADIHRK